MIFYYLKNTNVYILETYLFIYLFFSFGQIMKKIIMVNVGIHETFGRNTIEIQWPSQLFYSNCGGLIVKAMMSYNEIKVQISLAMPYGQWCMLNICSLYIN